MLRDTSAQDRVLTATEKRGKGRWLMWGGAVAFALLLFVVVPKFNSLYASDMSVNVEQLRFATVTKGDLIRDIAVQGRVVAANSPTLYVNSPGIVSLMVKAGDTVEQGQQLATIDSPELSNRLDQESATLEQLKMQVGRQRIQIKSTQLNNQQSIEMSEVELDTAKIEKRRAEISAADALISQKELEEALASFKRASLVYKHAKQNYAVQQESMELELQGMESQLERQQYVVNDLERQIHELTLTSPTTGVIGSVYVREKDNVQANTPLITVVDLSVLEIEATIPENYADDLGVGLKAEVSFNGEQHPSQLVAISPEVQDGQVVGRIRFNQQQGISLRQNQKVNARIMIESKQDVLKVKRGAFVESGGGRIAYLVDEDNAFRKTITLGARSINEVEVIAGLNEGDRVVISSVAQFNNQNQIYLTN